MGNKIFIITVIENGSSCVKYFINRRSLHEFVKVFLNDPLFKLNSVDNFIQKKKALPVGMVSLVSNDLYDYMNSDFVNKYGDSMNQSCLKQIQKKYYSLLQELYGNPTVVV